MHVHSTYRCIAWINKLLYSSPCSRSASCARTTSLFSTCITLSVVSTSCVTDVRLISIVCGKNTYMHHTTNFFMLLPYKNAEKFKKKWNRITLLTSSMFLGPTMSIAKARTFLQISILGDDSALKISIKISWTTFVWCFFNSDKRSKTISFTLLSLDEFNNVAYVCAHARTAVGAVDRETKVHAAYINRRLIKVERKQTHIKKVSKINIRSKQLAERIHWSR